MAKPPGAASPGGQFTPGVLSFEIEAIPEIALGKYELNRNTTVPEQMPATGEIVSARGTLRAPSSAPQLTFAKQFFRDACLLHFPSRIIAHSLPKRRKWALGLHVGAAQELP